MPRPGLPAWLRRGLEAAAVSAVVAVVSLLGNGLGGNPPARELSGLIGATTLAPAVLALAVVTTAYPVAMAATRADALLGAAAAFLVAADVTLILAAAPVTLRAIDGAWPAGFVAGAAAVLPALIGTLVGQVATPFGFGRRAGAWTAAVAGVASLIVLGLLAGVS